MIRCQQPGKCLRVSEPLEGVGLYGVEVQSANTSHKIQHHLILRSHHNASPQETIRHVVLYRVAYWIGTTASSTTSESCVYGK